MGHLNMNMNYKHWALGLLAVFFWGYAQGQDAGPPDEPAEESQAVDAVEVRNFEPSDSIELDPFSAYLALSDPSNLEGTAKLNWESGAIWFPQVHPYFRPPQRWLKLHAVSAIMANNALESPRKIALFVPLQPSNTWLINRYLETGDSIDMARLKMLPSSTAPDMTVELAKCIRQFDTMGHVRVYPMLRQWWWQALAPVFVQIIDSDESCDWEWRAHHEAFKAVNRVLEEKLKYAQYEAQMEEEDASYSDYEMEEPDPEFSMESTLKAFLEYYTQRGRPYASYVKMDSLELERLMSSVKFESPGCEEPMVNIDWQMHVWQHIKDRRALGDQVVVAGEWPWALGQEARTKAEKTDFHTLMDRALDEQLPVVRMNLFDEPELQIYERKLLAKYDTTEVEPQMAKAYIDSFDQESAWPAQRWFALTLPKENPLVQQWGIYLPEADSLILFDGDIIDSQIDEGYESSDDEEYDYDMEYSDWESDEATGVLLNLGATHFGLMKNMASLNSVLSSRGLEELPGLNSWGGQATVSISQGQKSCQTLGLAYTDFQSEASQFASQYWMFSSGGEWRLLGPSYSYQNGSPLRSGQGGLWLGLSGILGYVDHRITLPSFSSPDFTANSVNAIVNPGWLYGLGGDIRLQMGPIQIKGSVGYNWDGSDDRWRINKTFINSETGFVNNSVYYQISASYSIPLGGGESAAYTETAVEEAIDFYFEKEVKK
jgi:hypothetical protein